MDYFAKKWIRYHICLVMMSWTEHEGLWECRVSLNIYLLVSYKRFASVQV
jgi:hypothetical protein